MFNEVLCAGVCPRCGHSQSIWGQVRYGHLRGHTYRIGDTIVWDDGSVGVRGATRVALQALAECESCGFSDWVFDVWLSSDRIVATVSPSTITYPGEGYVVLEP